MKVMCGPWDLSTIYCVERLPSWSSRGNHFVEVSSDRGVYIRDFDIYLMNLTMSETAVVGKRYAVVIPKAIRERLHLKEGQRVLIRVQGEEMVVEPLPKDPFEVLDRLIGESYDEKRDEKRAEEFLKKVAGA